ncbi:MAG: hypothetical protein ACO1RT_20375, partial [Planctomycetaceae bacterium]
SDGRRTSSPSAGAAGDGLEVHRTRMRPSNALPTTEIMRHAGPSLTQRVGMRGGPSLTQRVGMHFIFVG